MGQCWGELGQLWKETIKEEKEDVFMPNGGMFER